MATVAERSRKLIEKMGGELFGEVPKSASIGELYGFPSLVPIKLIEQALLAERRLAKLEDAEIADGMSDKWTDRIMTDEHSRGMADGADFVAMALRAAAEKEVKSV